MKASAREREPFVPWQQRPGQEQSDSEVTLGSNFCSSLKGKREITNHELRDKHRDCKYCKSIVTVRFWSRSSFCSPGFRIITLIRSHLSSTGIMEWHRRHCIYSGVLLERVCGREKIWASLQATCFCGPARDDLTHVQRSFLSRALHFKLLFDSGQIHCFYTRRLGVWCDS